MNSIAELRGVKDEIAAICQRHGVQKLSLFGSALQQTLRQDSDFDFLVEFKPDAKIGLIEFGRLQLELETLLNRKVDLVSSSGLKPFVKERVLQSVELLYAG